MAVTPNPPVQIDFYSWKISWTSSLEDPVYYIYVNGKFYATTSNESITIMTALGESSENIMIEILDSADDSPSKHYHGRATLNWDGSTDVDYYIIKKCVNESWTEHVRIYDHNEGHFSWTSKYLADVTKHLFQIIPVGKNGNEGSEVQLTCLIVRYPNIPDKDFAYSNMSHKIMIS